MNRQMAAAILEHYMPKRNIHNKNKVDYLAYATAINALRREDALIDRVLEIIDKHGEQLVHSIVDGSYPEIKAADVLASVREDISDLKGGEME